MKLGCVMPGESPQVFGDAIRRLAQTATYLYQGGSRYWYSTQPTVTKLAEDRALQLERDPDKVHAELRQRLGVDLGLQPRDESRRGGFARVHLLPRNGGEVPDELDTRLVVLDSDHAYARGQGTNPAEAAAQAILESRGTAPRLYHNTLAFLAADRVRLQDLDDALRRYLAWESIVEEKDELNLDPHQARQAETQRTSADSAVTARLPKTYQWVLTPSQKDPRAPVEWQASRLSGSDPLAVRAGAKLRRDQLLVGNLGPTIVRRAIDDVPLWRGDRVPVRTLVEDFAQQLYLQRVAGPAVLAESLRDGVALLTWRMDTFAYAESFDDGAGRYLGLRGGELVGIAPDAPGLIVKADVAGEQIDAETPRPQPTGGVDAPGSGAPTIAEGGDAATPTDAVDEQTPAQSRRYHASVRLDPARVGRDASQIAEEVIAHLVGLAEAAVTVTIDIEAQLPNGAPDQVVRTVTENGRTLQFEPGSGFEHD